MADKSITVSFVSEVAGEAQNAALYVELDSEYNDGASRFLYGAKAYIRVYRYPSSLSVSLTPNDGIITAEGSGEDEAEETVSFANSDEGSVGKPVQNLVSYGWFGKNLGIVTAEGTRVTAANKGVGVCKINYVTEFTRYAISVPEKDADEYPVIVFVEGV